MDSNLVDLFTNLSQEILKNELDVGNDEFERKKKNGVFNKYIGKLRQKCFDVVFRNQPEVDYSDPCKTPYGADWSPSILLLDYGGELAKYGLEQTNTLLYSCIKKLEDKGAAHINELFKFIFILRDSCSKPSEELKVYCYDIIQYMTLNVDIKICLLLSVRLFKLSFSIQFEIKQPTVNDAE